MPAGSTPLALTRFPATPSSTIEANSLYAAGARRAIVTCDIEDFAELTGEFIATNREHAGIVLIPPSFRTDEFAAITDAVEQVARDYPGGLTGAVVFLRRSPR